MNARVIKVKFADPAKPGKKQATIKDEEGTIYGVWPKQFGLFQPGRAYRIEFSEHTFQGKPYRTITKCEPAADVEERTNDLGTLPQRSSQNYSEAEFVAHCLAASIAACAVGHSQDALLAEARMWSTIYRQTFTQRSPA